MVGQWMRCRGCGSMLVLHHPHPRPQLLLWLGQQVQGCLPLQLVGQRGLKYTLAWWLPSFSRTTEAGFHGD
jgi:hypothetical protein